MKRIALAATDVHVGNLREHPRVRVYASVTLSTDTYEGDWQDIEHRPVTGEIASFSASWWLKGRDNEGRHYEGGGQTEPKDRVLGRLAPGITAGEVSLLDALWGRWHLNTMRAGCAHMPAWDDVATPDDWPVDRYGEQARKQGYMLDAITCSAGSGYRYGHAWLIEVIPDDVFAQMKGLIERLNGAV